MQLTSELSGQRYYARSATIALAILLFLSVYQFIALVILDQIWASLAFLVTGLVQIRGLLTIQHAKQSSSLSCLLSVLLTWIALDQAYILTSIFKGGWFYLLTICTYFLIPLNKANPLNLLGWLSLFAILWQIQSPALDLAVLIAALSLILLMNVVVKHIASLENELASRHVTDPVLGCANRQALEHEMSKAVELNKRYGVVTSALALNVQNLEELYAETNLDEVNTALKELVQVWISRLRNTDQLCRFNDSQFICLLPNTELNNALLLSDDLLKASESYDFSHGQTIQLYVSVAESNGDESAKNWLQRTLSK